MAAVNPYRLTQAHIALLNGPYAHAAAVTPHDTNELAYVSSALNITVAGDIKVVTLGGETVTLPVPVGEIRIRVKQVFSTGTTATGIVALW